MVLILKSSLIQVVKDIVILALKDRINEASDEELLDLLASDGMLIKRPIVTDDTKSNGWF